MSNDLKQKIRELQRRNSDLNYEVRDLSKQVKKWSTYCAYVAGTSIGIIGFLQLSGNPEPIQPECPEASPVIEKRVNIQKVPSSNKNTSIPTPDQGNSAGTESSVQQKKLEKERLEKERLEKERLEKKKKEKLEKERLKKAEATYPKDHTVKSGETFSKIALKYYKRAALANWLAAQNETDPDKLQIGQELTIPEPPPKDVTP
jgi:nucleoid-associated protein YgaU